VEGPLLAVLFVVVGIPLGIFEELAEQGNDHAVTKGEARLQDVGEVLSVAMFLLALGALQQVLVPQDISGELLRTVDGDGIAVVDEITAELLAADQPPDQLDVGLLDTLHIDLTQQPKQGVGMRQRFELWKQ